MIDQFILSPHDHESNCQVHKNLHVKRRFSATMIPVMSLSHAQFMIQFSVLHVVKCLGVCQIK